MVNAKNAKEKNKVTCHDCKKEITINGKEIINGHLCIYKHNSQKIEVYKCKDCFKKNPSLINFQDCEVYSRVVGYLRPVKQWNEGKQEEYSKRKEYRLSKSCCS